MALQRVVDEACTLTGLPYGSLLVVDSRGRPSEMFHHGKDAETLPQAGLEGIPVQVGTRTLGLLYLGDHEDGSPLSEDDSAMVRALVSVAGYVLEHGRSHAEAERRRVWQNHAASLSDSLQPPFDLSLVDRSVTDLALRASGGVAATLSRPVDGEVVLTATSGTPPDWIGSAEHESAVHAAIDGTRAESEAGADHVVMLASLHTRLSPPGVLAVYHPTEAPPDDFESDLFGEYAEQAALTLDRAHAFKDRERMAMVTDRDRIARELHDVVIQRLFAAGIHLQKSRGMTPDAELQRRLSLTMQDLDQTIRAIRDSIFDLQADPRRTVRAEMGQVLDEHAEALGFVPTVHTEGAVDHALPRAAHQLLMEVLREALSNLAEHAHATGATVQLRVAARAVELSVSDDGRGLAEDHHESGLARLRRAAEGRGGTLELSRATGGGTELRCHLPIG